MSSAAHNEYLVRGGLLAHVLSAGVTFRCSIPAVSILDRIAALPGRLRHQGARTVRDDSHVVSAGICVEGWFRLSDDVDGENVFAWPRFWRLASASCERELRAGIRPAVWLGEHLL